MALKRFVNGIAKEPFFQKRAPDNPPDWIRTAELTFPSGRTADEIVVDDAAGLAWIVNLGCIDLNPHPVRADDLDHPDELRVDLDPVPGVPWSQIRDVAMVCREALEAVGLVGWPKTSGSRGIHINVRIERAGRTPRSGGPRWPSPATSSGGRPDAATSKWWKEERHGVFLDYNQNAKDRTVASAYSVRPLPDARVSTPLTWDEVPTVEAEAFTIQTSRRGSRRSATRARGSTRRSARSRRCWSCRRSTRRRARAMRRGRRTTPSRRASRRASSRRASAARTPSTSRAGARPGGPPPEVAAERAAAVAAGDPNAGLPTEWEGTRPTPTGRRKTNVPVIEISRAASKAEALEGLERWKARHPKAAAPLEPADVLVDGMRGRSSLWYRVRVNLTHVPEAERPAAGAARSRLRPVGRLRVAGPRRPAGARAAQEEAGRLRDRRRSPDDGERPDGKVAMPRMRGGTA